MERRLVKSLADWSNHDIDALISARVPEGQRLEYKRQLNLGRGRRNMRPPRM
jgi:hypothetical protein